jgi:hypothetical protein
MTWHEAMLAWLASPEPPGPGDAQRDWRAASTRIAAAELAKRGREVTTAAVEAEIARWPAAERTGRPDATCTPLLPAEQAEVARRDRERRAEPAPAHGPPEPPWSRGATSDEILAFGLSECLCGLCPADNRPDGSSIPLMDDEEIRRLLAVARLRLPASRTPWLEGYAASLVAEIQRRAGVR